MIDGAIPCNPSPGSNPDLFLDILPEDIWESSRRPIGHSAWECSRDVVLMNNIAKPRREARLEHGALVLLREKVMFKFDENGQPVDLYTYPIRDSNKLIEEYMLMANFLVAEELIRTCKGAAFIRCHPMPDLGDLQPLRELGLRIGIPIDVSSSTSLQRSLCNVIETGNRTFILAVTSLLVNPMPAAEYMAAGSAENETEWRHFALNIPYYTHFTSPIRRYADVMVHRLLDIGVSDPLRAAELELIPEKVPQLTDIAVVCNEKNSNSRNAQIRSDEIYMSSYLIDHPYRGEGVVVYASADCVKVLVLQFGFEVKFFLKFLPFDVNFDNGVLSLRRTGPNDVCAEIAAGKNQMAEEVDLLKLTILTRVNIKMSTKENAELKFSCEITGSIV